MTEWILLIVIVMASPVFDGGPERVGDVIHSSAYGTAATEETCAEGGEALTSLFKSEGGRSIIVGFDCVEIDKQIAAAISEAQEWEERIQ